MRFRFRLSQNRWNPITPFNKGPQNGPIMAPGNNDNRFLIEHASITRLTVTLIRRPSAVSEKKMEEKQIKTTPVEKKAINTGGKQS